jgi:hypothetical protein
MRCKDALISVEDPTCTSKHIFVKWIFLFGLALYVCVVCPLFVDEVFYADLCNEVLGCS